MAVAWPRCGERGAGERGQQARPASTETAAGSAVAVQRRAAASRSSSSAHRQRQEQQDKQSGSTQSSRSTRVAVAVQAAGRGAASSCGCGRARDKASGRAKASVARSAQGGEGARGGAHIRCREGGGVARWRPTRRRMGTSNGDGEVAPTTLGGRAVPAGRFRAAVVDDRLGDTGKGHWGETPDPIWLGGG